MTLPNPYELLFEPGAPEVSMVLAGENSENWEDCTGKFECQKQGCGDIQAKGQFKEPNFVRWNCGKGHPNLVKVNL